MLPHDRHVPGGGDGDAVVGDVHPRRDRLEPVEERLRLLLRDASAVIGRVAAEAGAVVAPAERADGRSAVQQDLAVVQHLLQPRRRPGVAVLGVHEEVPDPRGRGRDGLQFRRDVGIAAQTILLGAAAQLGMKLKCLTIIPCDGCTFEKVTMPQKAGPKQTGVIRSNCKYDEKCVFPAGWVRKEGN